MQKSVYTLNTSNTTDTVLMRQSYNTNKEPIALSQNCKLDEAEPIHITYLINIIKLRRR
jgi:hypothetical protein